MESVTFVLCLLVLGAHALLVFGVECNIDGHKLNGGEKYTPKGTCMEYECHGNGAVSLVECPMELSIKACKEVEEDLSKPYPSCCSYFEDC
ncbi:uncharacterized protein [Drosophila kikkawai]|uniref:Single domain-containing protein n=1 Tax=Drosophila kikkawai TaxID=30033 RepID=A0A6P4JNH2_DROKI|nr:uncharacterized protein LOC108084478 [Drosophila kikkawai]